MQNKQLLNALLDEINNCGTIMNESEFFEIAFGIYGETEYIEDADGNIVEENRICTLKGLQDIADIYTNGFDCFNF